MSPEWRKQSGQGASKPELSNLSHLQAKTDSSVLLAMIISCSLPNAFFPSPYRRSMFRSKIPSMQYAVSSSSDVTLSAIQLIFCAVLAPRKSFRCSGDIFAAFEMMEMSWLRDPMGPQLASKNSISRGASISCSVQPRVNHSLSRTSFSTSALFFV